jgi:hypothetical protein
LIETYLEAQTLSEEVFKKHLAKIEMDRVNQREESARLLVNDVDNFIAKAQSLLSDLPQSWNHLNPDEREQFLRCFEPFGGLASETCTAGGNFHCVVRPCGQNVNDRNH